MGSEVGRANRTQLRAWRCGDSGPRNKGLFSILAHQRLWTMRFSLTVRNLGDAWESGFSTCEAGWGWVGIRLQKQVDRERAEVAGEEEKVET